MKCRIWALLFFIGVMPNSVVWAHSFKSHALPVAYQQQLKRDGLWSPRCPVPLDRLRLLTVSYYDFQGRQHENGHLIVMDAVADTVLQIFKALYDKRFPFTTIVLSSQYAGDDRRLMQNNATSAFNCRAITGGTLPSIHAYGLAIDINPIQNPYISHEVLPSAGKSYVDRRHQKRGMIEPLIGLFKQQGFFVWGGQWRVPIDYQHVQPSRLVAQVLVALPADDAKAFFRFVQQETHTVAALTLADYKPLLRCYRQSRTRFLEALTDRRLPCRKQ